MIDVTPILDKIPVCSRDLYRKPAERFFIETIEQQDDLSARNGMPAVLKGFFRLTETQANEVMTMIRKMQDGEE